MDESILSIVSNFSDSVYAAFQNETERSSEFLVEFVTAIDWTQPWLIALMVFHLSCTVFIVLARHHVLTMLVPLFAVFFVLCAPASYINEWAADNHTLFATEQYFDSAGMFISIVYSLPMMLNAILILVFMLIEVSHMVVSVKRTELRHRQRQQEKSSKSESKKTK
eukprot:scpid18905/ scgid30066/ Transmembrane protein 18